MDVVINYRNFNSRHHDKCKVALKFIPLTRIHSSRMRTAHSSSHLLRGCLSQCMLGHPPPRIWAWRPPWCGPGDPPGQTPQLPPLGEGLETPLARPLNLPLGVGLETCNACWDTTTPSL